MMKAKITRKPLNIRYLALWLPLISMYFANAQVMPVIMENALQENVKLSTRYFGQEALWGYINGGADLYLEYGFDELAVQEIEIEGWNFKADIYRMHSAEAAYGIYSILRFRCARSSVITTHDCLTAYQYIAAKGNYCISVANTSGSEKEQELLLQIAEKLLEQIEDADLQFPSIFREGFFAQNIDNLKFITGPLGIQNGFVKWESMFSPFRDFNLWTISGLYQASGFQLAYVYFESQEDANRFIELNNLKSFDLSQDKNAGRYGFITRKTVVMYDGQLSLDMADFIRSFVF